MRSSSTATGCSCTSHETVRVHTRRGHDWTKHFKKVADDAFLLQASSAIIEAEIVVPAFDGSTDFSVLQNQLRGKSDKIVMVAFDLLHLNGNNLRKLPLVERKAHLLRGRRRRDVRSCLQHRPRGCRIQGSRQPLPHRPGQ